MTEADLVRRFTLWLHDMLPEEQKPDKDRHATHHVWPGDDEERPEYDPSSEREEDE